MSKGKRKTQSGGNVEVSQNAYNRPHERDKELTIEGEKYVLDENNNRRDTVVYRHPESGKVILGLRGTEVNKGSKRKYDDLWEDALIATGAEKLFTTKRNAKNQRIAENLLKELDGDTSKLRVTGHSLGAGGAVRLGQKYGLEVDGYNPGTSPLQLYTGGLKNILKPNKATTRIYSTGVDPLSATAYYLFPGKKFKSKWTASNPHSLDNFTHLIEEQRKPKQKK